MTPIDPLSDSPEGKLVKALLSIEWHRNGGGTLTCQGCGSWTFSPIHVKPTQTMDRVGCYVDEALTRAGYPDHESREHGRSLIRAEELRHEMKMDAMRREAYEDRQEFDKSG
jgi:hypothetical protein